MSIAKPFIFQANTYAKSSEVNADFDVLYSQVNTNISNIAQNSSEISNLNLNKANKNGNASNNFAVANPVNANDAVNKQTMTQYISNVSDFISGYTITKDNNTTIIVSSGSCWDKDKTVILAKNSSTTKSNSSISGIQTWYVYVMGSSSGTNITIELSTSNTSPSSVPSGYKYRQIGYYKTNSSGYIESISYYGVDATSNKSPFIPAVDYSAGVDVTSSAYVEKASADVDDDNKGYNPTKPGILCAFGVNYGSRACKLYIYNLSGTAVYADWFNYDNNTYSATMCCIPVSPEYSYKFDHFVSNGPEKKITFFPYKGA